MRYHYEKPSVYSHMYEQTYKRNHDVYTACTLYLIGDKGLAVIQQRCDPDTKKTWCGVIDDWLVDDLYLLPRFKQFFDQYSGKCTNGLYPTVTIRQIMWGLKMKPINREPWETYFDRKTI